MVLARVSGGAAISKLSKFQFFWFGMLLLEFWLRGGGHCPRFKIVKIILGGGLKFLKTIWDIFCFVMLNLVTKSTLDLKFHSIDIFCCD